MSRRPNKDVFVPSLSQSLNELVCVDHSILEQVCLSYAMDMKARQSTVLALLDTLLNVALIGFKTCCISQFWKLTDIWVNKPFMTDSFEQYCDEKYIQLMMVLPKIRSTKNIEQKWNHKISLSEAVECSARWYKRFITIKTVIVSNKL